MRKTTKCFLLGLLAAKLGGVAYVAARLKLSLPTTGGELSLPCLDSPVEVIFAARASRTSPRPASSTPSGRWGS